MVIVACAKKLLKRLQTLVNWDTNTKTATVTYDTKKTNLDAILKRVADAGYDNEKFSAPNAVYDELHGCCQYDREASPKKAEYS